MKKDPKEAAKAAQVLAKVDRDREKLLDTYNGGLPYDRRLIISQVKVLTQNAFETVVEVGKRLILLKEFEGHGGFMKALEEIGLEYRTAHNMALVAQKLSNVRALSNFNKGQLYLIANSLSAEEVAEAEASGTLDKYESMSYRQLQAELRKRDTDAAAKKAAKDVQVERLKKEAARKDEEIERLKAGLPSEDEAEMEKALTVELLRLDSVLNMLATADTEGLSERMKAKVLGAYEYAYKRAYIEMLEAKQRIGDVTDEVFDGELTEAESVRVRGGWERHEALAGGRHA